MANALNADIQGRHVVIKESAFKPEFSDIKHRVFLAQGGFGCHAYTAGTSVFGKTVDDGDEFRISGDDIERFATDEEITMVGGEV